MPRTTLAVSLLVALLVAPSVAALHFPTNAAGHFVGGATVRSVDQDADGLFDDVLFGAPVRVFSTGPFRVVAQVTGGDVTRPATVTATATLTEGDRFVDLIIPGDFIANQKRHGTYDVFVRLYTGSSSTVIDTYHYETPAIKSSAFAPARASFAAPAASAPVDVTGDGAPDTIAIDFFVATPKPGTYRLNTTLQHATGSRNITGVPDVIQEVTARGAWFRVTPPAANLSLTYAGALRFNTTLFAETPNGSRVLDITTGATSSYRFARLGALAPQPMTNVTTQSATPGTLVAASGLAITARVADAGPYDWRVTITEAREGRSWSAATGLVRHAPTGADVKLTMPAADAARVLGSASAPVAHYSLKDSAGLIVAGGAIPLEPAPFGSITFFPAKPVQNEVIAFDRTVETFSKDAPVTHTWNNGSGAGPGGASYTTTFDRIFSFTVTSRVTNQYGYAQTESALVTTLRDDPPVVTKPGAWHVNETEAFELTVAASDPNGRAVVLHVLDGPPGLTAEGLTLNWTAPPGSPDIVVVRVAATDGTSDTPFDVEVFVRHVDAPPSIRLREGFPLTDPFMAQANAPLEILFVADDPNGDAVTMALVKGPGDSTFDVDRFMWRFPTAGDHSVNVSATANNVTTYAELVLRVVGTDLPAPEPATEPSNESPDGEGEPEEGEAETPGLGVGVLVLTALGVAALRRRVRPE